MLRRLATSASVHFMFPEAEDLQDRETKGRVGEQNKT